jgi:hypothetical protein
MAGSIMGLEKRMVFSMKRYSEILVFFIIFQAPFYTFSQTTKTYSSLPQQDTVAANKTDTSFYYRVGWDASGGETEGIHLFKTYRKGLYYHVFSIKGTEVFSASQLKKEFPDGCSSDDKRISWLLQPDTVYEPRYLDSIYQAYTCLVVGTKSDTKFNQPVLAEITEKIKMKCKKVLGIADSSEVEPIQYYSAGINKDVSRILLQIPTPYGATLVIIDIRDDKYKIVYKKTIRGECRSNFSAQADLDQDGICETFSLDFCDYGGKWLLTMKNNQWILWADKHQPQPC